MTDQDETAVLLREIRDDQREALALQRQQHEWVRAQMARAEALQSRAESLQGSAGKAIRVILWIALPLLALVLLFVLWPYARYMFG
jgi:hypothetical protein